jgi:hypothetical protein
MSNKRVDRLEVGANFPKSPNDEVVWIDVENNNINRYDESTNEWISVGGSEAGTFDDPILKDNVRFTDTNDSVRLKVEHGGTGVVRLHAPEDDLALRSANDILLYAGDDGPGNVYIGWGDATYTPDSTNRVATIGDIQDANTGDITFVGSTIIGNGTIDLVPDNTLTNDSYLIITPTDTNHIHIRAGGPSDNSDATLILGGERNKVSVSDTDRSVVISTAAPDELNYDNFWEFGSNGYLTGPAMGGLFVSGILNGDNDLWLSSGSNVVISSGEGMGVFLENQDDPDNQVATIGDFDGAVFKNNVSFTDNSGNEQIRIQNGDILFDVADHLNTGNDIPALRLSSFPGMGTGNLESEFTSQGKLLIFSRDEMILNSLEGTYIGSISSNNQVATIGDLPTGATGSFDTATHTVTVTNGIITDITAL